MNKIIRSGLITGVVLLVISYILMMITIQMVPSVAEEYFDPMFNLTAERQWMFWIHPFIFGLGFAWVWDRFKPLVQGSFVLRGLEIGLIYVLIATLPNVWMTMSAFSVSFTMIFTWFLYGVIQATVAGIINAWLNP